MQNIDAAQSSPEVPINENFTGVIPAELFAYNPVTSSGLTWGYLGGRYNSSSIANGTVSLTASNDNYVVAARSSGTVSVSTATTNWNDRRNYLRLYKVTAGGSTVTSYEDHRQYSPDPSQLVQCIFWPCGDETTAITSGAGQYTMRMPYAFTLLAVRASLTTAQSSGSIFTLDINEAGASIFSTTLTIDNTEKTSTTAATPAVISDSAIADDAEITVDIDQVGSGTAAGLKVYLIGLRA